MARKDRAAGTTRRQATRMAVIAFLAADCAGIWYAQHRLSQPSPAAARFTYETPGMPAPASPTTPIMAAAGPSLARTVPAPAPVPVPVPAAKAPAAPLPAPKAFAAAPRVAPAPVPGTLRHTDPAPATAAPFDNAFALDGEAPEAEQRFGQNTAEAGGLADLLVPREEPVPIFDKAGIAPVTGQSASIAAPAEAEVPGEAAAADLQPGNG